VNRPSILFIFCDQMRADCLSAVGHPVVRTPHLDSLAGDGTLFTRAYTQSPLCVPARASLFTGLYPHQHGCTTNPRGLWPWTPNIVGAIRDSGYHTANRGKLHLFWRHHNELLMSDGILKMFGFDDPMETTGKCSEGYLRASAWTEFLRSRGKLEAHWEWLWKLVKNRTTGVSFAPSLLSEAEHIDGWILDRGKEFITSGAAREPFFLWLGPPGPHDPFDPPGAWATLYSPEAVDLPIWRESEDPMTRDQGRAQGVGTASEQTLRAMRALYYGNISFIDHKVGELIDSMKAAGTYENTWIVFSSDHGEMLGDFQCTTKKVFHEQSARIPLIVKPPADFGGPRGRQNDALVELIDLGSTFLEIAGARLAEDQGRSLFPLLRGESGVHRECVHSQVFDNYMARDCRQKLIFKRGGCEPPEFLAFFDLEKDPLETRNLLATNRAGEAQAFAERYLPPFFARTHFTLPAQWDDVPRQTDWPTYPPVAFFAPPAVGD
jgi:arylsulfatase A-like enzyme